MTFFLSLSFKEIHQKRNQKFQYFYWAVSAVIIEWQHDESLSMHACRVMFTYQSIIKYYFQEPPSLSLIIYFVYNHFISYWIYTFTEKNWSVQSHFFCLLSLPLHEVYINHIFTIRWQHHCINHKFGSEYRKKSTNVVVTAHHINFTVSSSHKPMHCSIWFPLLLSNELYPNINCVRLGFRNFTWFNFRFHIISPTTNHVRIHFF